jgi:hypothetical protein
MGPFRNQTWQPWFAGKSLTKNSISGRCIARSSLSWQGHSAWGSASGSISCCDAANGRPKVRHQRAHRIVWVKIALKHPSYALVQTYSPEIPRVQRTFIHGVPQITVWGQSILTHVNIHAYGDEKDWSELQSHCFQGLSLRPTLTYTPTFHILSCCFPSWVRPTFLPLICQSSLCENHNNLTNPNLKEPINNKFHLISEP